MKGVAVAGALCGLACLGWAQTDAFELRSGGSYFLQRGAAAPVDPGSSSEFRTQLGFQDLFRTWWWYRLPGDTQEWALNNQTLFQQLSPSSAKLTYMERGVKFELTYSLQELSASTAILNVDFLVTSLRPDVGEVDLFWYADYDLANSAGFENGTVDAQGTMTVEDLVLDSQVAVAATQAGLVGWSILEFPTLADALEDDQLTSFGKSPMSLSGDWTGAYQWHLDLSEVGQGGSVSQTLTSVIPEPTTLAALALGAAALIARRRRSG